MTDEELEPQTLMDLFQNTASEEYEVARVTNTENLMENPTENPAENPAKNPTKEENTSLEICFAVILLVLAASGLVVSMRYIYVESCTESTGETR